ncbi:MAG: AAA ATPase [Microgenomates group bacterium GW2011_GWA2_44_7]|nr:MAG: AAA ATPase [Microgenomates group bacterium GW2011_GWA2_44_7]KKT77982.1 MAG: AAA ATPase [Microgenomates group bacterium GW2011_GWB1_44_8]
MEQIIKRRAEDSIKSWLDTKKILLVLGARQVGKTTLLKNFFRGYKTTYLNLDVESDKLDFRRAASLDPISAIKSLSGPQIVILDEAQRLPETSRVVKGWYDYEVPVKIILSGSSNLNLLDQSAESLTGRNIKLYLPPLLFSEIISSQSWFSPIGSIKFFKDQIESLLLSAMVFGSYPEAVVTPQKQDYLTNLVTDYLLKDIFHSGLIKTPELIHRLLSLLAYQSGSVVSVNELANNLKISRITIDRYLDLLEQTFVIFRLPAFSSNPRKEIAKSQKIFFWDTGVRNALISDFNQHIHRPDIGKLWENWVIAEFAKSAFLEGNLKRLYFWQSRSGAEVDLVVKEITGELKAFEIKWSPGKTTKAFTPRYGIPVNLIHRENFMDYVL